MTSETFNLTRKDDLKGNAECLSFGLDIQGLKSHDSNQNLNLNALKSFFQLCLRIDR